MNIPKNYDEIEMIGQDNNFFERWGRAILLCSIVLLSACHQTQPPIVPFPQPVPGPVTPPPPTPQTQPNPHARPPAKVHIGDRMVTLGGYGMFNSATSDYMKIAKTIYDAHKKNGDISGMYTFLMNPWNEVPKKEYWPWIYDPVAKQFLLDKPNPVYYQRLDEMLNAFAWYRLDLILAFEDVYFTTNWAQHIASKLHPYRQNDAKINYGSCPKCIYDGITFGPTKYWLFNWTIVSESQNKWIFVPANKLGAARADWIKTVVAHAAKVKKANPDWRLGWKKTNEELGKIDPATGKTSTSLGLGDRSELFAWSYEQWKNAGLTPNGKDFFAFVNRNILGGTAQNQIDAYRIFYPSVVRAYGNHFGMGSILELHINGGFDDNPNDDDTNWRDTLVKRVPMNPKLVMWSTDGVDKPNAAGFQKELRDVWKQGDPFVDLLFEECIWNEPCHAPYDFMYNFNAFFPYHAQVTK